MKVKDLVNLKGCYSAYDVGELEVDLPDVEEIEKICKWGFERHPGVTPKQIAQTIAKRIGSQKNREGGGMKEKETIEKGDRVDVFFSEGEGIFDCEVIYTPCSENDSWHLRDKDGDLVYVQRFEMMRLKKQGKS